MNYTPHECAEKWNSLLMDIDDERKPVVAWIQERECVSLKEGGTDKVPSGALKYIFPALAVAGRHLNPHEIVPEQVEDAVREGLLAVMQNDGFEVEATVFAEFSKALAGRVVESLRAYPIQSC